MPPCRVRTLETGGANDITVVTSRASPGYKRIKPPHGKFKADSHGFGKGGTWSGANWDLSLDKMTFLVAAHVIAKPLGAKSYLPAKYPKTTRLLIMFYWGTTHAPGDANESKVYIRLQRVSGEENFAQSQYNENKNGPQAGIYQHELKVAQDEMILAAQAVAQETTCATSRTCSTAKYWGTTPGGTRRGVRRGTAHEYDRKDLQDEIEEDRYFVVPMASDSQLIWRKKKHKLLWENRFSILQQHHDFDRDLAAVARYASQKFGQETHGLIHDSLKPARVEIGDVRSLGSVAEGGIKIGLLSGRQNRPRR